MIRVLHYVGAMNFGGTETLLMEIYRHIDREKIQFDFMVHNKEEAVFDAEIKQLGGKIFKFEKRISQNPLYYYRQFNVFFRDNPQYRIIHAHQNALSGYVLAAARENGVTVKIAHSHVMNPQYSFFQKFVRKIGLSLIKKNADYVFGCSEGALFYLSGEKKDNQKYFVVRNAIDIEKFKFNLEKRQEIRKKLGISERDKVIGNVANLNPVKNHKFLLDILEEYTKQNQSVKLVIIGEGMLRSDLEAEIAKRNLANHVLLLGTKGNVHDYLSCFDCFLFPSLYEGLGIVLVEAQANGLPCVASTNVPKEADCGNEQVKYLDLKCDIKTWMNVINNGMRNYNQEQIYSNMTEKGYNIKELAEWLESFYEKVAK